MRKKFVITLWVILFLCISAVSLAFYAIWHGWIGYMPNLYQLENPVNKYASQAVSADGKLLGTWSYSRANRIFVGFDDLSPWLVKALVATEDERFYDHSGIDYRALARAVVKRGLLGQSNAGGGSTITQQLAKQLYSDAQSTMERALQKPIEWVIAVKLERYYTKEEIITMYLNYFDFLHNAVGIKTASRTYFNKEPQNLSVCEAATLIGMCKNPSYFNPVRKPERCRERRNVVLDQMVKAGYLSKADAELHKLEPIGLRFHRVDHKEGLATYLRERLRTMLMAKEPNRSDYASWQDQKYYEDSLAWETDPLYGWCNKNRKKDGTPYNLYTDGLKIYTTIDSRMQQYAEESVEEHVAGYLQPIFDKEKRHQTTRPFSNQLSTKEVEKIMRTLHQDEKRRRDGGGHPKGIQYATRNDRIFLPRRSGYHHDADGLYPLLQKFPACRIHVYGYPHGIRESLRGRTGLPLFPIRHGRSGPPSGRVHHQALPLYAGHGKRYVALRPCAERATDVYRGRQALDTPQRQPLPIRRNGYAEMGTGPVQ